MDPLVIVVVVGSDSCFPFQCFCYCLCDFDAREGWRIKVGLPKHHPCCVVGVENHRGRKMGMRMVAPHVGCLWPSRNSCSIEKLCSQRFQTRGVDAMTSAKYNFRCGGSCC
ncbi:uncharacterized protein [Physcomitrium patens]|uniref:uncharacterized protein isoform X4 n=1 Tax=Physcomitrium patens TaxID=3218 RepID=UPI000D17DFE3|nr:uncharacterized protein LOC112279310 isoform X4 [Physcomitrium patens]|eukprot:XP_024369401.1 uncharacterized protein LOC112279310 isoform X4 [Physcomitrella patens]